MADGGQILRAIFWFCVFWVCSFWISALCYPWWLLFGIIQVCCCPDCGNIVELLQKGVSFPIICARNIVNCANFDEC